MDLAPEIERNVAAALAEDVGSGDLTAPLTPAGKTARAVVMCRQEAVICGQPWFDATLSSLDARATVSWSVAEGMQVAAGTRLCEIQGQARALLAGGRTT